MQQKEKEHKNEKNKKSDPTQKLKEKLWKM